VPDAPPTPRRVAMISLGGTIAMTSTTQGGVAPALSAQQLLAAIPGLADLDVDVQTVDFRQLPGASLGFDDLTALAALVHDKLAEGVDGVVVVQGTDTIEETSYLLDLYHAAPQPVVVTGAMRNPTLAGADGPANLLAAVQTAASSAARDLGCLVVLADEIHAARRVRKTHSTAGATFQSPNGGPLGYLVEGRPRLVNVLSHRTVVPAPTRRAVVRLFPPSPRAARRRSPTARPPTGTGVRYRVDRRTRRSSPGAAEVARRVAPTMPRAGLVVA
jgi:L-asparaginase